MVIDPRVLELLSRREAIQEEGQSITPEDLCADCPELLSELKQRIGDLERMKPLLAVRGRAEPSVEANTPRQAALQQTPDGGPGGQFPVIPGYEILQELGRGGMGVVYQARHVKLNRLVALKMILSGDHAGPKELARFRREAEAVARLQHPHIVQIYEIGEQQGRPYFALEYVDGGSLEKKIAGTPQPPREAAQLVETLARAMQHAHDRGILHRDLKPANVLLTSVVRSASSVAEKTEAAGASYGLRTTDYGLPKITDFGLAKRLDAEAGQTQSGAPVGTPSYMAPEQAEGKGSALGPTTDVYALGAILYELLTGRPPFRAATMAETLDQVRAQDPLAPTQLQPKLARDLETICLKCLQKDPAKRYSGAGTLADDLGRFLRHEPIEARPVGRTERSWRWCRRNPKVASLALALVLVTMSGFGTVLWQWWRAEANLVEAKQARNAAEAARRRTREALDAVGSEAINTLLTQQKELTPAHKAFLHKMLAFYQEFAEQTDASSVVRAEAANAYFRMGEIREKLGELGEAEAAYRRSRDLDAQLVAESSETTWHSHNLSNCSNSLGSLLAQTGRHQEAARVFREALAAFDGLAPDSRLRPEHQSLQAKIFTNMANLLWLTGNLQEAEQQDRQALAIWQQLAAQFPTDAQYRFALARVHANLGLRLYRAGVLPNSEQEYRAALRIRQGLAAEFPAGPDYRSALAQSFNFLAILLRDTGRLGEAERTYREALAVQESLAAEFPAVPEYRYSLAASHGNLGTLLSATGRQQESEQVCRNAQALLTKLVADFPTVTQYRVDLAQSSNNIGLLLSTTGRLRESEAAHREAVVIRQKLLADLPTLPQHRMDLAMSYLNLGTVLEKTDRAKEAERAYRDALMLCQQLAADFPTVPEYQNSLAGTLVNLANLLRERKELSQARQLLEQAVPHHQNALEANSRNPTYRQFFRNNRTILAEILASQGEHAAAAQAAEQLARIAFQPAKESYGAACVLARCSGLAEHDPMAHEAVRKSLAQTYADRAMDLLRQAVAKGFRDAQHLRKDKDLDPLRAREDFKKLLAELAAR